MFVSHRGIDSFPKRIARLLAIPLSGEPSTGGGRCRDTITP
ncbi:hypothetical protein HMPREF9062_2083 [Actinomyces sp. oral taxon 448 str. F0400]|nr:hypothetical protein HMPREF9062_2083 [Actinomyces sp. oral taxon 448 str. F0400]